MDILTEEAWCLLEYLEKEGPTYEAHIFNKAFRKEFYDSDRVRNPKKPKVPGPKFQQLKDLLMEKHFIEPYDRSEDKPGSHWNWFQITEEGREFIETLENHINVEEMRADSQ